MKPNNILFVPCTDSSFYRSWLEFLTPYHKLSAREKDVAASLLVKFFKFKDSVEDEDVLYELMWSKTSRKDLLESLKMSNAHFQMVLSKLKSSGFLKGNRINPRFLPHKVKGENRFMLQVIFDWSSDKNPIKRAE